MRTLVTLWQFRLFGLYHHGLILNPARVNLVQRTIFRITLCSKLRSKLLSDVVTYSGVIIPDGRRFWPRALADRCPQHHLVQPIRSIRAMPG